MISRQSISDALEAHSGQVLTPELIASIIGAADVAQTPLIDSSSIEPESYGEYIFVRCPFKLSLPAVSVLSRMQWNEMELFRNTEMAPNYGGGIQMCDEGRLVQFLVGIGETGDVIGQMRWMISVSNHTGLPIASEDSIYILPDHRKGFLATRFLSYCVKSLSNLGVSEFFAGTRISNRASSLYKRAGFKHVSNQFHLSPIGAAYG